MQRCASICCWRWESIVLLSLADSSVFKLAVVFRKADPNILKLLENKPIAAIKIHITILPGLIPIVRIQLHISPSKNSILTN